MGGIGAPLCDWMAPRFKIPALKYQVGLGGFNASTRVAMMPTNNVTVIARQFIALYVLHGERHLLRPQSLNDIDAGGADCRQHRRDQRGC